MSEHSSVQTLLAKVRGLDRVHYQRFEDKYQPGIPDLNVNWRGREQWLEAKWIGTWPARESTGVRVPLKTEQCLWATSGLAAGRNVRCVLRIVSWGWAVWDARDVSFYDLKDGVFNRERILELARWHGKVLDVEAVVGA